MQLAPLGIWAGQFRTGDRAEARAAVAELDELGFGALWVPGGGTSEILDVASDLLGASKHLVFATGILNVWMHEPGDVAKRHGELEDAYPGRFLLGLGVSHAAMVEANTGRAYERPRQVMVEFLDGLDAAERPVPNDERVLAALGPRMLELARVRSLGAHPYLVPPEHTRRAREILGPAALLAPELKVVLDIDPVAARTIARAHLGRYLESPNYANNLLRLGFTGDDLSSGGSDHVVDSLVAWGGPEVARARYEEHLAAGADHVCVQVLTADPARFPLGEWRVLAEALAP